MRLELLVLAAAACAEQSPVSMAPVDFLEAYGSPNDFELDGCVPGALAGTDPVGSWRLGLRVGEYARSWGVLTVAEGPPPAYDGFLLGDFTGGPAEIGLNSDFLFARARPTDERKETISIFACSLGAGGRLIGHYAECRPEGCRVDDFVAGRLGRIPGEADADGLELVAELRLTESSWESPTNVRVDGDLAFLIGGNLWIVDISDPTSPALLSALAMYANDVKIVWSGSRRYALVAGTPGVTVVDVTSPRSPVVIGDFPPIRGWGIHTLFTETLAGRTRAYLAGPGLIIYDVTEPGTPVFLGSYELPEQDVFGGYLHDLYVENGRAYLSYWNLGLVIVDTLDDPAAPRLVGRFADYPYRTNHSNWVTTIDRCKVAVMGDEGYGAHIRIVGVDESCPESFLRSIGELETRPEVSVHNIMAKGTRAYVTYYQDGVRIFELADPSRPAQAAYFNTYEWTEDSPYSLYTGAIGIDLDPTSGLIYVADTERGLLILRETP